MRSSVSLLSIAVYVNGRPMLNFESSRRDGVARARLSATIALRAWTSLQDRARVERERLWKTCPAPSAAVVIGQSCSLLHVARYVGV